MKKIKKILLVSLSCLLVAGCSCSKEECKCPNDTTNTTEVEKVVITDYSKLYKDTVRSVVMVKVQKKNDKNSILSTGSGVVAFEEDGRAYIYTNAHVVKGLTTEYEVEVFFSDESGNPSGASEIVNYDYVYKDLKEDVAVIEINKSEKYKLAKIANSDLVEIGDFVYTIGSPLSKFNYTTSGNVASVKSPVQFDASNTGYPTTVYTIMFDAAINEGNSGGALFNDKGELVGITSLKYNQLKDESGKIYNAYGMYGALPVNYFDKVAKHLIVNENNYVRPSLNLELLSINEMGSRKQSYGISDYVSTGVYVIDSRETSNGIYSSTIITAINNKSIRSTVDFYTEILKYNIGDKIVLTITNKDGLNAQNKEVTLH